ncbi:MAG: HD domain-containing protein [Dehalococcoidia bacterium]|nr:HD domain-containing protein [Dehalococcoidia bacterium]
MDAPGLLTRLAGFFADRPAGDAWLVGGAVRDALLGREIHDIDLAISGEASRIGPAVANHLGGTAVPVAAWNVVRVALPPEDESGRPFLIDISGYHGPFEDDLRSRDFTVDAMALPLECWDSDDRFDTIVDPTGGQADLVRRILRATGDDVFSADPGRMLRSVRLANQLGFRMDPDTTRAIRRDAPLLSQVSAERVRDEFLSILAADGARVQLEILDRLDLLCRVIPELEAARNCDQPRAHHYWDVWGHLLHCVEYAEAVTAGHRNNAIYTMAPWTAVEDSYFSETVGDGHSRRTVLKLAALLHDIAKPQTKAPDAKGRIRFLGHSEQGAEIVEQRLSGLRLSNRVISLVSAMVLHHLRPSQLRQGWEMPSRRAIYRYYRDLGDAAVDTLYLAMADFLAARGPELSPERWGNYARMIATVLETGAEPPYKEVHARGLVDGHDLIDALNIPQGPLIGTLLERLREAEAVGEVSTREDALNLAACLLAERG